MGTRPNPTPVRDRMTTSWWKDWRRAAPQVWSPPALSEAKRQNTLWRLMWTAPRRSPQGVLSLSQPRRMRCSRVIPPQWLERWPSYGSPLLTALSLRMVKLHSRSHPPRCVSEALHMSPPHHLGGRRKKEHFDVRIGKQVTSQTQRQNQAVFIVKMYM